MDAITTCLWFDDAAEEAAEFYISIVPNSRITDVSRYSEGGIGEPDKVMVVNFELNGQPFMGLNGGPQYSHSPAVSWVIHCEDQAEVDRYWDALTRDGGQASRCGWLIDRFGISWQIVPKILGELLSSGEPAVAERVTAAFMQMAKLDIATLLAAAEG